MTLVLREQSGGVCKLTLNRPDKMNAYSYGLHDALLKAIDETDRDTSVRAIVVTGAGRAFCAGADISNGFSGSGLTEDLPVKDGILRDSGGILNMRIFNSDTPIIAAVNGAAVGIGATMLLPMDIKIVSEKAKFAFPFARRGIVFDGAASFFLPRVVGLSRAQHWVLRGNYILPQEALGAGMINEVVPHGTALERAMEIAQDIAVNVSPKSAAQNKQLIRAAMMGGGTYDGPDMNAHMRESAMLQTAFASEDCLEGVNSFLEKRPPEFQDYIPKS